MKSSKLGFKCSKAGRLHVRVLETRETIWTLTKDGEFCCCCLCQHGPVSIINRTAVFKKKHRRQRLSWSSWSPDPNDSDYIFDDDSDVTSTATRTSTAVGHVDVNGVNAAAAVASNDEAEFTLASKSALPPFARTKSADSKKKRTVSTAILPAGHWAKSAANRRRVTHNDDYWFSNI
jgi:hypothetical protein